MWIERKQTCSRMMMCLCAALNVMHLPAESNTLHVFRSHTWSDAAYGLHQWMFQIHLRGRFSVIHAITCSIKSSLQSETTKSASCSFHCGARERKKRCFCKFCAYDSTVAWLCLFPVDAAEQTPSVSEQQDLGWLIEYWLNCFDLWPSSLYGRKVLRHIKWKLLPLIVPRVL